MVRNCAPENLEIPGLGRGTNPGCQWLITRPLLGRVHAVEEAVDLSLQMQALA